MRLSVVIPVYNEAATLKLLLDKVLAVSIPDVTLELVIVEDASKDASAQILKDFEKLGKPNVKIYYKAVNEGKGAALRDGFARTTGEYVIIQDADLEYEPRDYAKLLAALKAKKGDVIYGSRFSGSYEKMTNLHFVGNKILTVITNVLFGGKLTDMETCYKLLPGEFARSVKICSRRFDFEPEITAKIIRAGLKIYEVPISYSGRNHSEGKKITWRDGLHALKTLIRYRFFA